MWPERRGGTAPTPTGDPDEDFFGCDNKLAAYGAGAAGRRPRTRDTSASDLVDLNLALRADRGKPRRTPPPPPGHKAPRAQAFPAFDAGSDDERGVPAETARELPRRAPPPLPHDQRDDAWGGKTWGASCISRPVHSGKGSPRTADGSPSQCAAPCAGAASPSSPDGATADDPPPVGPATRRVPASATTLREALRSRVRSSPEPVRRPPPPTRGVPDPTRAGRMSPVRCERDVPGGMARSRRSASARADCRAAPAEARREPRRHEVLSASAAHRRQRGRESRALAARGPPATPRLTVRSRREVAAWECGHLEAPPKAGPVVTTGGWASARDAGAWPAPAPSCTRRPPSRQKGAFPTELDAEGAAAGSALSRGRECGSDSAPVSPSRRPPRQSLSRCRREVPRPTAGPSAGADAASGAARSCRPPSRQKQPQRALFLDVTATRTALRAAVPGDAPGAPPRGPWSRPVPPRAPSPSSPGARTELSNPDAASSTPAAADVLRVPRGDADRHHDPEADGFAALGGARTPCPFRIQVTRAHATGLGSTVELDDLGLGAASLDGYASPNLVPPPAPEDVARALFRNRPPSVRGVASDRRRPRSAHPSPYRGRADRAVFDGAHCSGQAMTAVPVRRASAKAGDRPFLLRRTTCVRLSLPDFAAKQAVSQAPNAGGDPRVLERHHSMPGADTPPSDDFQAAAMPPAGTDAMLCSTCVSGGDPPSSDEDRLEIASGSSFGNDDETHLETNLGEEFLSLFALP